MLVFALKDKDFLTAGVFGAQNMPSADYLGILRPVFRRHVLYERFAATCLSVKQEFGCAREYKNGAHTE